MNWAVWKLVLTKTATLQELDTHWSVEDVAEALEALGEWEAAQARAAEQARRR